MLKDELVTPVPYGGGAGFEELVERLPLIELVES